jgi:hypothetical protein
MTLGGASSDGPETRFFESKVLTFWKMDFGECSRRGLVVVPPQPEAWLSVSLEQLVLRRCAFWCSLAGQPESDNESSVTVQAPPANIFDAGAVIGLMRPINEGGVS